jgi:hypothetical protein
LDDAGIQEFDLSNIQTIDRERNEGNVILSRSTYTTTDGRSKEVAAVDFTTNPIGYEFNDVNLGKLATAEEGTKSLVLINQEGENIDLSNWDGQEDEKPNNVLGFFAAGASQQKQSSGLFLAKNGFRSKRSAATQTLARVLFEPKAKKGTKPVAINSILKNLKTNSNSVPFLSADCFLNEKLKMKAGFDNDNFANENLQNCVVMKHQQKIINL